MTLISYPSLYLRQFLPNSEKGLPTPAIVFSDLSDAGGQYWRPQAKALRFEGRAIDCRNGIIEVGKNHDDHVIAHEWRHHWQHFAGIKYDGIGWNPQLPYWEHIVNYFEKSRCEMDALIFTWRRTNMIHEGWRDVLKLTMCQKAWSP